MKHIYALFALLITSFISWGQTTVTKNFSEFGFSNAQTFPSGTIDENISFTTEKNSSQTDPAYYDSGATIRLYPGGSNGGSITLNVNEGYIITSVTFISSQNQPIKYFVDGGEEQTMSSSDTYTINENISNSLKFQNANTSTSGSSNQLRLTGVTVTYTNGTACEDSNFVFASTEVSADLAEGTSFSQTATSLNQTTAITYTSSDEDVATVNPTTGEVTLVSVGTTTITATQAAGEHNGESYCAATATYELEVITTEPVLTVSTNSLSFTGYEGGSFTTQDLTITGLNLTGDITLTLTGDTNFSINPTTLSATGGDVTITYTPSATPASHSATLTVANGELTEVITLSGVTTVIPEVGCFEESFDDILDGNSTSSNGSSESWDGNDNFPTVVRAYQAGGAVRLGSSNNNGSITSVPLTEYAGHNVVVSFSSKAWGTNASSILISFGTQSQVVNLPAASNWTDGLSDYEVVFENIEPNATLTFESNSTSERRFFIDNISVCIDVTLSVNFTQEDLHIAHNINATTPTVAEAIVNIANLTEEFNLSVVSTTEDFVVNTTGELVNGENTIQIQLADGLAAGEYTGSIIVSLGEEILATLPLTGEVVDIPLSTPENAIEGLRIYPNPATDVVFVTSNSGAMKNVQLFDLSGKKVLDVHTTSSFQVNALANGIYVMKVTEEGKTSTSKLIVK